MGSNKFIQKEVDRVVKEFEGQYPLNLAMASSWIIANFKGINIKVYDVSHTSSLADYYILASATNPTQANAIVDELMTNIKRHGSQVISTEGLETSEWVLVDFGDIIVHIFLEYTRDIYDLDTLWAKYDQVQIPNEYYMGSSDSDSKSGDDPSGYF